MLAVRATTSFLAFACCLPLLAAQQDAATASPVERRAREVAALIAKGPKWSDELLDASLVKQLPRARMTAILEQYFGMIGAVTDVQLTERRGEHAGTFDLIGDKDQVVQMSLTVASKAPHSIVAL